MSTTVKLLLSERELAESLGVSTRHIYTLRTRQGLPFVRLGARIMYRPADVERWLAERTNGGCEVEGRTDEQAG